MSEVTLIRNPESPVVVIQPTTTTITAPDNMDAAETATQAALEANLARNDAQGSAAAADADRIAAETARTTAQAAATEATAQATAADASADAAAASASAAASSATQASSSQSAAAASATTAAAQAAAADAAQSQAATSASQALASKNAAEAAQSVVAASAQDAADQADLAETYKTAAEIAAGASLTNASQAGVHRVEAEGFADAAETSALAAASSASSASADKTATAADRVATGADRLASAASATAADGSADAALVSAVNAANSASSALSSKSAAETARDTAVTARTAAENAADTAESANAAAQSASSTAQTARSAAETARAAAEGARDQAATSAGQASASATAAASSASAAAGSEMTVQLDRIAAAASATASEASAVASQTSRLASEAARDASISAKTASETARDAAQIAKTAAETAETNAETAEVAAEAAQGAAETARNAAQTSAGQASASKDAAALSATAAATSATEADADRVAAQTARTGSEAARDAAQTAQSGAETARTAAQTARTGAETARTGAETAQTEAQVARTGAEAAQVAAAGSLSLAISQASTASSQASLAAGHAASASSVVQQDLSGITAQALHRSPNAITAMAIYDTSKDSDGGAWTEKCQHTSWYNEALSGKWLGAWSTEASARAAMSTVGQELLTNGSFDTSISGWSAISGATLTWDNGRIRVTSTVASSQGASQNVTVVAGRIYRVTVGFIQAYTSTGAIDAQGRGRISVGWNTAQANLIGTSAGTVNILAGSGGTLYFRADTSGTATISIGTANDNVWAPAGNYVIADDISVREVTALNTASNDYFQLTTDGKFYRLWKNVIPQSDNFAVWPKSVSGITVTPDQTVGSTVADVIIEANGAGAAFAGATELTGHFLWSGSAVAQMIAGATYTFTVIAKQKERTQIAVGLQWTGGAANGTVHIIDLSTKTRVGGIQRGGNTGVGTPTITDEPDGFVRITFTAVSFNAAAVPIIGLANGGAVNYTGNGTSGIYVKNIQVEFGSTATTYEPKAAEGSSSEVFRGNKADFPRLAAIVAEGTNVNIYDLTEPGRPMWMRFISNTSISTNMALLKQSTDLSCVATGQGKIIVLAGSNSGYHGSIIDFPLDGVPHIINGAAGSFAGNIAQRNSAVGRVTGLGGFVIGGTSAGAVAMTVLPDAPIDTVTGLRVPTIAVATNSSVSVIKHNGTVVNGGNLNSFNHIYIDKNILMFSRTGSRGVYYATNPGALGPSFGASLMGNDPDQYQAQNPTVERFSSRTTPMRFATPSVHRKWNHEALPARGLNMAVSSTFNTGWLPGDIRRAYLSDATSESIGPGGNIVTNGDFATDVTGWTPMNGGSIVWSSGSAVVTGGAANTTGVYQPITCVVGKTYRFQVTVTLGTTTIVDVYVAGNATGGGGAVSGSFGYLTSSQTFIGYFTATATTHSVALQSRGVGLTATFDNVSVTEAVLDRSYKSATAPIFGTLTKAALATGTSLVGYSGFSAANYLREAYSPELEFGTGEWSCSAWVNVSSTTAIKGNLVNGSAVASSWGFALFGISVLNTGETIAGFGTVSKLRWSAGDGPMGREIGSNQVFSFYVKKAEFKILYVRADQSTSVYPSGFWFDMDTGTVLSNTFPAGVITATAAPEAGAGWYRIAVKGSHGNYVKIFVSDDTYSVYHGNTTSGYLICGAQLEVSSVPGPFVQTSGGPTILTLPVASRSHTSGPALTIGMNSEGKLTATSFDGTTTRTVTTSATYNNATWLKAEACYTTDGTLSIRVNGREVVTSRGNPLLSLNSRYNLLFNSEQFDSWSKNQATVSSNAINAPDGTLTADLILDNTVNAEHYVSQSFSCSNGIAYNFTGYLKKKTGSYSTCSVRTYLTGVVIHIIDFDAGTITNGGTLTSVGDGWYKFDITRTASATGTGYLETYTKQSGANVGSGSDGHYAWGFQVAAANAWNNGYTYQRVGTANDVAFGASLTIGNNFATDAPFPGSIALLKLSATVPTYEQSQFMYEQEKQLFRVGAQSVLPDSGSIVDMAYDDATDRWVAVSGTNESYWTGLVRNSVTPVPAGSYTRVVAGSGLELVARSTTNPGVDVTIPAYGLREELVKRAEAAARLTKEIVTYDYVGGFTANTTNGSTAIINVSTITYPASYIGARISGSGIPANTTIVAVSGTTIYLSAPATATATGVSISFLDFDLPVGMEAKAVLIGGSLKQEGTTKDYTRLYDGFIEIIRFAVAPGATAWVQIQAQRITLQ